MSTEGWQKKNCLVNTSAIRRFAAIIFFILAFCWLLITEKEATNTIRIHEQKNQLQSKNNCRFKMVGSLNTLEMKLIFVENAYKKQCPTQSDIFKYGNEESIKRSALPHDVGGGKVWK